MQHFESISGKHIISGNNTPPIYIYMTSIKFLIYPSSHRICSTLYRHDSTSGYTFICTIQEITLLLNMENHLLLCEPFRILSNSAPKIWSSVIWLNGVESSKGFQSAISADSDLPLAVPAVVSSPCIRKANTRQWKCRFQRDRTLQKRERERNV